jgi:hypothetical protein
MKYDLDSEIREWRWRQKFDACGRCERGGGVWNFLRRVLSRIFGGRR